MLQDLGNELRSEFGSSVLSTKAIQKIEERKIQKAVIVGIRNPKEVVYLKKQDGFYLLGLDADPKIRYKRVFKQRGQKWIGTYGDFAQTELRDSHLGNNNVGLRARECLKQALMVIDNSSTKEELLKNVRTFFKKYKITRYL